MPYSAISLIVPVENQVREFDPKLLVACAAAERGFHVVFGSRTRIDFSIARFPRSIYLAKGMTPKSAKLFRIARRLGHEIAALDEEGLVYHSPEEYYARRVSDETLEQVTTLLSWGEAGAELLRNYPAATIASPRVTGNPRMDLLRPELRGYYAADAARIRERLGPFVLVNTNFAKVNAYFPKMNLIAPPERPGASAPLGGAGIGLPREFAEGLSAHKQAIFDHFRELLPALHDALPDHQLVIRPHPSENRAPWLDAVRGLERAHVIHEGNVVAWLDAASALVHNGCTTGIEAFFCGTPALAYRPVTDPLFDLSLPNELSVQCFSLTELRKALAESLVAGAVCRPTAAQRLLIDHHIAARGGELAADRIVDVLAERAKALAASTPPRANERARGWASATTRSLIKRHIKARVPQHRNNPAYQRNRYPGLDRTEIETRIARLGGCLGRFHGVGVEPIAEHIYAIHTESPAGTH